MTDRLPYRKWLRRQHCAGIPISITDHAKGLKIAGGIDEDQLERQGEEIAEVNHSLRRIGLRVLRSIELNLSPDGQGDMEERTLKRLDLVLGCFHSALRRKEDQTERYLAALRNPSINILGIREAGFTTSGLVFRLTGPKFSHWPPT